MSQSRWPCRLRPRAASSLSISASLANPVGTVSLAAAQANWSHYA